MNKNSIFKIGSWIFLCALFFLFFLRMFFGVDFTDEPWYIAMAYRFVLGDKPFVDELLLMQGFALITAPFVKFYLLLGFGTEGIVLFFRFLYCAFNVAVASVVYFVIRNHVDKLSALAIALIYVLFIPFSLPNLSYNTVGMGFFTAGSFLAVKYFYSQRSFWIVICAILLSLSVIAHASYLMPVFLLSLINIFWFVKRWLHRFYFCISFVITIFFFLWVYDISFKDIYFVFLYTRAINENIGNKYHISKILKIIFEIFRYGFFNVGGISLFLVFVFWKIYPSFLKVTSILIIVPLVYMGIRARTGGIGLAGLPLFVCCSGSLVWWIMKRENETKVWFFLVYLPSLFAGIGLAFFSFNGILQAGTHMMPGAIASVLFTHVTCTKFFHKETSEMCAKYLPLTNLFLLCSVILYLIWNVVYMDEKPSLLKYRVTSGPFKGLMTSKYKVDFISSLSQDVLEYQNKNGRILFFPHFPAGYLISNMKPAFPLTWGCLTLPSSLCTNYFLEKNNSHDIAFWVKEVYFYPGRKYEFSIDQFKEQYDAVIDRLPFVISKSMYLIFMRR